MSSGHLIDSSTARVVVTGGQLWRPVARRGSVTTLAPTVKTERFVAVDAMRFAAATGVVFVHAVESPLLQPWADIGRLGVPFYLFIALLFAARSFQRQPLRSPTDYSIARFKRLYIPFLAWSAIYGIARTIKRVALDGQSPVELEPRILWSGTQYHLWFLSFLLFVTIIAAFFFGWLARQPRASRWPLIIAIGSGLVGVMVGAMNAPRIWNTDFQQSTYPFMQMLRSAPAAFWAFSFAILATSTLNGRAVSRTIGFGALGLTFIMIGYELNHEGMNAAIRALCGMGCMICALAPWRGWVIDQMARLGRFSFGIYLSHVLVVEVIRVALHRLHLGGTPSIDMLAFTVSFGGSLAIAVALSRQPKLAWLSGTTC